MDRPVPGPPWRTILVATVVLVAIGAVIAFDGPSASTPPQPGPSADEGTTPAETGCPTQRRFANPYHGGTDPRPDWRPESTLNMSEIPHVVEVTRYPHCEPTREDYDAAWELYNATYGAVEEHGWFDFESAREDGYYKIHDGDRHYMNVDALIERGSLDPDRPEFLIYYEDPDDPGSKVLAGVMYERLDGRGEQIGGPLTVWHYHPMECCGTPERRNELLQMETAYGSVRELYNRRLNGTGPVLEHRTGEMLHVWLIENPWGPFASNMTVPETVIEEPVRMNESAFKTYAKRHHREQEGP